MGSVSDQVLERAEEAGRAMLADQPRAVSAVYNPRTGRIAVELTNGRAYIFPARRVQDLHDAKDEDLAHPEIDGLGFNLRFPGLDVDLFVPALVAGIFGTRAWMEGVAGRSPARVKSRPKRVTAKPAAR